MKKLLVLVVVVVVVCGLAAALWVRSFGREAVRDALAAQIAAAIGQPVSIADIDASLFPRVTIALRGVAIGQPARVRAQTLRLGTNLRALLSRQIVGGTVNLDGAVIELPLPAITLGSHGPSPDGAETAGSPLEVVSIDEVVFNDVRIVGGGRTIRGDLRAVPHGDAITLSRLVLVADDTVLTGSGEITSLAGPVGTIALESPSLDFGALLEFFTTFSQGAGLTTSDTTSATPAPSSAPVDLTVSVRTDRAAVGTLVLDALAGQARVTPAGVNFDRIEFGVFDGRFAGSIDASGGDGTELRLQADVTSVDVGALTTWAGNPGVISGRLAGRIDVRTRADDPAGMLGSSTGTARVEIRDGVVGKLGLVKSIVVATSMRGDTTMPTQVSGDERFSRLGATLRISNGRAGTNDLTFESPDVLLRAAGALHLDGSSLNLRGDVQLSDALSQQAGRDLVRYTQQDGRVTLPITITGPATAPSVQVNLGNVMERAIKNRLQEEITKGIGGLFRRKH